MKQIAVRSLVWGLSTLAFLQLPALARIPVPSSSLEPHGFGDSVDSVPSQLIAVSLSRRDLRIGDRGADVRILQRYLSRNGLYPYVIDGVFGQETANAVATYQRIRELPATGIADEETLVDMGFDFDSGFNDDPVAFSPQGFQTPPLGVDTLGPGSTGSDVIALQQRLNSYGIPVSVDGIYGFETQQGVRTYQRVQELPVSGTADRNTLEAMGFSVTRLPYVVAMVADEAMLESVQQFFPAAYLDRDRRRGQFINVGSFAERRPAEARANAVADRFPNSSSIRVLFQ
ncbi:MAG: peptidoglycan-binding protein [Cyanobacteria bacterium P01_D01_bin.36]